MKCLWFFLNVCAWSWTWTWTWTWAAPDFECPAWVRHSGMVFDLAKLADAVSSDDTNVHGYCANYSTVFESSGKYDTRLRVYNSSDRVSHIFSFRPTQQNPDGESIHSDRQMSPCSFLPECSGHGKVHHRFQEAFLSLIKDISHEQWRVFLNGPVFTCGHSLGGSLQLFAALYMYYTYNVVPSFSIGFAGPFIGDMEFTDNVQRWFELVGTNRLWLVETVNQDDVRQFDGTVEGYQVNGDIFIDRTMLCGFGIHPLSIPSEAYGMHDLKQYTLWFEPQVCYW